MLDQETTFRQDVGKLSSWMMSWHGLVAEEVANFELTPCLQDAPGGNLFADCHWFLACCLCSVPAACSFFQDLQMSQFSQAPLQTPSKRMQS